jgi:glycerol-3-phosphate acyltransferase PlsY
MNISTELWLAVPVGYLLGSIPFGLLLGKLFGAKDVRQHGSGNIGATNVSRVAGPFAGILTLILDAAKGAAAVWLGARVSEQNATVMMLAGLGALCGHCFPIWLKLKGGKGVATGLGVFAALSPLAVFCAVVVFALAFLVWRYVSLASLTAAASMPLLIYFLWAPGHAPPLAISFGTLAAATLIFYKHRANLQRLAAGEEPKFQSSKSRDKNA